MNDENLKPFKKGQSGNLKGRPPMPDLKEAISKVLNKEEGAENGLEVILSALYKKAKAGDVRAIQEMLDRGFGKSTQLLQHDVPEGLSITIVKRTHGD